MPSFVTVTSGATAQAQDVNQLINAMNGTAGQGVPISLTAVNDSVNFALAVKNADPTNSRSLQVLRANNNVLIQADASGVIVSPDGGATTAQVVNTTLAQTLTNKTLTNPVLNTPTFSAGAIPAAALANNAATLAQTFSSSAGGSTASAVLVDVPNLTSGVNGWTARGNGPTLAVVTIPLQTSLAATNIVVTVNVDGATEYNVIGATTPTANQNLTYTGHVLIPASVLTNGAHTVKCRYSTSAGTLTIGTNSLSSLTLVELNK